MWKLGFGFGHSYSVGFFVTGIVGKTRIHSLATSLTNFIAAFLAASVWRASIRVSEHAFNPYTPKPIELACFWALAFPRTASCVLMRLVERSLNQTQALTLQTPQTVLTLKLECEVEPCLLYANGLAIATPQILPEQLALSPTAPSAISSFAI
ncbi:MAG: hypothetical protein P3M73_00080 [Candidatus Hodgkinia cicadicola]|nr:MAG: hypothetical protein P3M73_00080 [Candidatus Hodgkinia cicadicola]